MIIGKYINCGGKNIMAKTMKTILSKLVFVMCIVVIAFLIVRNMRPYERDYFLAVGIEDTDNNSVTTNLFRNIDDVTKSLGEPIDIKETIETNELGDGIIQKYRFIDYFYDGLNIRFWDYDPRPITAYMVITSSEYRFGFYNIGVGSPRWLVDFAYKSSSARVSADTDRAYIDDDMYVEFSYDKENKVEQIKIFEFSY